MQGPHKGPCILSEKAELVLTILIVVPDNARRAALGACLASHCHSVLSAADAEEALSQAALHLPQVILVDMSLPDLPGYDLFRVLRTTPPHHQSWMVAVGAHTPDPEQYDRSGINASVNRDCSPQELVDQLIHLPGSPLIPGPGEKK